MTNRNRLEELISALEQQRDELSLKIHLGKKEAQDEWSQVTDRLDQLQDEYEGSSSRRILNGIRLFLKNAGQKIGDDFDQIYNESRERVFVNH